MRAQTCYALSMPWTAAHRATARASTERRIEGYRALMVALLADDPTLTTDQLAERLGYDRSTIRRWRRALRESEGAR